MADHTPRLMRSDEMPLPSGYWLQCTHPVLPGVIVAVAFGLLAAAGLALPVIADGPWWAYPLAILWSGVMALIAAAFWSVFQAALRPTNWLLRADDSGLFVKFRSYRNHAIVSAEPDVLFLPRDTVTWLRARTQTVNRRSDRGNVVKEKHRSLDIKLADDAWLAPVRAQLKVERGLWIAHGKRSRSRHGHYPVAVGDGLLHVAWRNGTDAVRPRLDRALVALARWYPVEGAIATSERPVGLPSSKDEEDRIVALLEAGEKIQAVKLTRELYGVGLREAKDFVEELVRR